MLCNNSNVSISKYLRSFKVKNFWKKKFFLDVFLTINHQCPTELLDNLFNIVINIYTPRRSPCIKRKYIFLITDNTKKWYKWKYFRRDGIYCSRWNIVKLSFLWIKIIAGRNGFCFLLYISNQSSNDITRMMIYYCFVCYISYM